MLFLVQIEVNLSPDMPDDVKEKFRKAEHARSFELRAAGKLRRSWRPLGTPDSCGLWEADSLEELHANVRSLPLYPYMKVSVTPLVEHPATAAWEKEHGPLPAL